MVSGQAASAQVAAYGAVKGGKPTALPAAAATRSNSGIVPTATVTSTATVTPTVEVAPTDVVSPTLTPAATETPAPAPTETPALPTPEPAPTEIASPEAPPVEDPGLAAQSAESDVVAAACTAVNLKKGPTLILTGSSTSMKIAWQWSTNTTFTVKWGTSTAYSSGSASVSASNSTYHTYAYTISGLAAGTKYYYQAIVGSQCASGTFRTPPSSTATTLKFFAYGDTRTNGGTHNTLAGKVISKYTADPAFQTFNLHVGDWVSSDSESAWTGEWFNSSYANIRKQDANIPDVGVRGNHEGGATYWKRYFPQPYQSGGLYRSFNYGPAHIVLLDQYTAYNAGSAQYNWLKNDLAASTKKWKFVVLHEPGWSAGGGHGNNTTVQKDLEPLFRQYGVSIVFGGHNHYYARATVDGIQHLTVGGGGAPLASPSSSYPNIVKVSKNYSYSEFTISGSTLTAKVYTSGGTTIDSFTITR